MSESRKKRLVGKVTSDKMDKTIVVAVETKKAHPLYGKVVTYVKKYKAHDEENSCKVGDRVQIIESRPMSRHKRWALDSILEKS